MKTPRMFTAERIAMMALAASIIFFAAMALSSHCNRAPEAGPQPIPDSIQVIIDSLSDSTKAKKAISAKGKSKKRGTSKQNGKKKGASERKERQFSRDHLDEPLPQAE